MSILTTPQNSMKCEDFHHWLSVRDIHDAVLPREAAAHLSLCPDCERLFHLDGCLEDAVRKSLAPQPLPKELAAQVSLSLDQQATDLRAAPRPAGRSRIMAAGMVLACLVIALATVYFPFSPESGPGFQDLNQVGLQAVKDHLAGNRQMTFTSGQVAQALETLTQKLGFQVLLPDFESFGCTLLGGRLCALGDCRAAYFVLEKDGRSGSLFIMDTQFLLFDMADGSRFATRIKGCRADVWKNDGQIYAMVF